MKRIARADHVNLRAGDRLKVIRDPMHRKLELEQANMERRQSETYLNRMMLD